MKRASGYRGFTIVELLIVIVVIAILAAITVVAYNGITARSKFSSMRSDIASIQKAVELYYAENGSYPTVGTTTWRCSSSYPTNYVPNLATYVSNLPSKPAGGGIGYCYKSDAAGSGYKIIRLYQPSIPSEEAALVPDNMKDLVVPADRWGVWSSGGAYF